MAGLLVWAAVLVPAQAGDIRGKYGDKDGNDKPGSCNGNVTHGAIIADRNNPPHDLEDNPPGFGLPNWRFRGSNITEEDKTDQHNDRLLIKIVATHIKAPHGEDEGDPMSLTYNLVPGKGILKKPVNNKPFTLGTLLSHESHFDALVVKGTVSATATDITGYAFTVTCKHTGNEPQLVCFTLSPSGDLPETVVGSGAWVVEPSGGEFTLSLAVSNISVADIVAAHIRSGSPDAPGPIIFPLDPGLFDVDGSGVTLFSDGQFPLANIDDLLNGNALAEIDTPSGSLSGPIVDCVSSIGGIVELRSGASEPATAAADPSGRDYVALAITAVAAGAIVLAAGGWYVRRRWGRR